MRLLIEVLFGTSSSYSHRAAAPLETGRVKKSLFQTRGGHQDHRTGPSRAREEHERTKAAAPSATAAPVYKEARGRDGPRTVRPSAPWGPQGAPKHDRSNTRRQQYQARRSRRSSSTPLTFNLTNPDHDESIENPRRARHVAARQFLSLAANPNTLHHRTIGRIRTEEDKPRGAHAHQRGQPSPLNKSERA